MGEVVGEELGKVVGEVVGEELGKVVGEVVGDGVGSTDIEDGKEDKNISTM